MAWCAPRRVTTGRALCLHAGSWVCTGPRLHMRVKTPKQKAQVNCSSGMLTGRLRRRTTYAMFLRRRGLQRMWQRVSPANRGSDE